MSIPDTQKRTAEIVLNGLASARGSSQINTANIFHFRRTAVTQPLSKSNIVAAFTSSIANVVAAALNASWAMQTITCRMMEDITDPPFLLPITTPGAIAGDRLAAQNTAVLTLRSALRGRRYRGRKTFSPFSESDTTTANEDVFNAGAVGRLHAIGAAIVVGFTDADGNVWVPVVCTKTGRDETVVPAIIPSQDVIEVLLNKRIGRFLRRQVKSQF